MTWWSLVLILVWVGTFVAGQLFFKRAMESSGVAGFQNLEEHPVADSAGPGVA